jgi:hypothetical protein
MIPNNTKSGIISIIRFSGEKKHSTFSAASSGGSLIVNADSFQQDIFESAPLEDACRTAIPDGSFQLVIYSNGIPTMLETEEDSLYR